MSHHRLLAWLITSSILVATVPTGRAQEHFGREGNHGENVRWYKGNLHTHSLWSDGDDFPEMIALWYREHGYHFLALSDHNILSQGMKWMPLTKIESRGGRDALPKYKARFAEGWVQTRGSSEEGNLEVRLKPLDEVRAVVESAGEFLMIPSEEITDKHAHINATNILNVVEPQPGASIRETIQNTFRALHAQSTETGRIILPHLNHPNLGDKGIRAEDLASLLQDEFFEVWNGVEGDGDLGSERRHSLEALWDIVSTLRISEYNAPPIFGLATDDSHDYHGEPRSAPGRGWIMVRSRWLTPESILESMKAADFYASTGVELERLEFDEANGTLSIQIKPDGDAEFTTQFIGTPIEYDATTRKRSITGSDEVVETLDYSADVGMVFKTVTGHSATYQLTGKELYVRATITSSKPPATPTQESPYQKAWTQPVGWKSRIKR